MNHNFERGEFEYINLTSFTSKKLNIERPYKHFLREFNEKRIPVQIISDLKDQFATKKT